MQKTNGSVMVVNDSILETHHALTILKKNGILGDVLTKHSAWEALEFLQQEYVKGAALPRLIILDMNMPELSGIDFLQAFQHLPELICNWVSIVVVNASEQKDVHDYVIQFPQIIYYHTAPLSFDSLEKIAYQINSFD